MASSHSPLSLPILCLHPISSRSRGRDDFLFFVISWLFFSALLLLASSPQAVAAQCQKPPIIFNFGDSNSDTGGLASGLGFPVNLPNGRSFFRRSTGRLSDGRLLIDFLCQSLNTSFLSPYLDSLGGSKFTNGANFAVVGSSTLPKFVPFSLNIQLMQFLHFKTRSLELFNAGSRNMINEEGFRNALYLIDIGQNDLADSFDKNLSYVQVTKRIPSVIAEIKNAVVVSKGIPVKVLYERHFDAKTLHSQGGKKFWIHNTGPLGCLPQKLWLVQKKVLDPHGCLSSYNSAAQLFNEALRRLTIQLRSELADATIVYVDIYSIKYDLIANPSKYDLSNPLMACCGFGGPPYSYNIRVTCGQPGYQVCDEGSRFVSWDGIHCTETANSIIASGVLSGAYSTPHTTFDFFCRV